MYDRFWRALSSAICADFTFALRKLIVQLRRVELRIRHDLLIVEQLVAVVLELGLRERRLCTRDAGLRVFDGLLLQRRIDAREELPLLHLSS